MIRFLGTVQWRHTGEVHDMSEKNECEGEPVKPSDVPRWLLPLAPYVILWGILYLLLDRRGLVWVPWTVPVVLALLVLLFTFLCRRRRRRLARKA
jgi:fatty acid desaturase